MRASQKLLSPVTVEVDDICAVDPLPIAANVPHQPTLDDTVEIELTAEQMDALLSGR
ncbi:MAG TPA: hypothetical protein VJ303_00575 [Steroidobacteraceae bacterium]|jgi:hypothetical protein|nr:hypothetical protein [Steroidobacteraceae bacterium]